MHAVPDLPWPRNLFRQPYLAAATTAPLTRPKLDQATACACGCKLPHNHAVSKVLAEYGPFGTTRSIAWFRSMPCRQRWEAENVRE